LRHYCAAGDITVSKHVYADAPHFIQNDLQYNIKGAGWSGDRIPVGVRFSAPVQTGPGAQKVSYTKGTGSFPGVKRLGRGVDKPSAEVKERVELYFYSPSEPS